MESLKKFISLNEASKISGYTQDYLGSLIRKGEMKGTKKGNTWFTTEEEVNNYIFKRKIRNSELAIKEFFSTSRLKNIILVTILIILIGFFVVLSVRRNKNENIQEIRSAVTSDGESLEIEN